MILFPSNRQNKLRLEQQCEAEAEGGRVGALARSPWMSSATTTGARESCVASAPAPGAAAPPSRGCQIRSGIAPLLLSGGGGSVPASQAAPIGRNSSCRTGWQLANSLTPHWSRLSHAAAASSLASLLGSSDLFFFSSRPQGCWLANGGIVRSRPVFVAAGRSKQFLRSNLLRWLPAGAYAV